LEIQVVNCADFPIADFVDGELDPQVQHLAERHLQTCPACRELVADLRTVRAAAFTLDRKEPPATVLARIKERIATGGTPSRGRLLSWPNTRPAWAVWLAAAAALVVATVVGLLPLRPSRGPAPNGGAATENAALVDSVEADLQAAQAHYDKAIQGLEQIAKSDNGDLDPQVAAVFQKNLQVVDQAIDESRAALKTQPGSADVQTSLFEAMRTKVALLQQTVELINEMRKGNQAEAGRLMQDLSR
jgi:anti-sigma factor RsiW